MPPKGSAGSNLAGLQSRKEVAVSNLKILVTGASGVVGRRLVPVLAGAGHQVRGVARTDAQREALARAGAAAVSADLFDPRSLRQATVGCDAVINLATHMPSSSTQLLRRSAWKENDRIRAVGSANLVDAALAEGVGRFVQESFAPVYPDRGDDWIDEQTPLRTASYNRTILDAENSAARFTAGGRTGVVLRFAGFYGPDSRFLQEAIGHVRHGRAFLPGAPGAYVSSISHDDAASAAAAALYIPAGVYNVVDDEPLTRRDYFESLAQALGIPAPRPFPVWMKLLLGSLSELLSRSLRISNLKLRSVSAWEPKYRSVREGWPSVVAALGRVAAA
jgi:nucleoside-diphosphate-sugar epimerase